jgi:Na+/alanine symporter
VLSFKFSVTVVQFLPCQASRLPSHRSPFHHCPAIALSSSAILQRAVPDVTESIVAFFIVSIVMFFAFSTLEQAGLGVRFTAAEAQIPTSPERMVLSSTPQQAAP